MTVARCRAATAAAVVEQRVEKAYLVHRVFCRSPRTKEGDPATRRTPLQLPTRIQGVMYLASTPPLE